MPVSLTFPVTLRCFVLVYPESQLTSPAKAKANRLFFPPNSFFRGSHRITANRCLVTQISNIHSHWRCLDTDTHTVTFFFPAAKKKLQIPIFGSAATLHLRTFRPTSPSVCVSTSDLPRLPECQPHTVKQGSLSDGFDRCSNDTRDFLM